MSSRVSDAAGARSPISSGELSVSHRRHSVGTRAHVHKRGDLHNCFPAALSYKLHPRDASLCMRLGHKCCSFCVCRQSLPPQRATPRYGDLTASAGGLCLHACMHILDACPHSRTSLHGGSYWHTGPSSRACYHLGMPLVHQVNQYSQIASLCIMLGQPPCVALMAPLRRGLRPAS